MGKYAKPERDLAMDRAEIQNRESKAQVAMGNVAAIGKLGLFFASMALPKSISKNPPKITL